jgi:hypothetical protein
MGWEEHVGSIGSAEGPLREGEGGPEQRPEAVQVAAGTRRIDVDGDAVAQESAKREMSDEGKSKGPLEHQVISCDTGEFGGGLEGDGAQPEGERARLHRVFPCLEPEYTSCKPAVPHSSKRFCPYHHNTTR